MIFPCYNGTVNYALIENGGIVMFKKLIGFFKGVIFTIMALLSFGYIALYFWGDRKKVKQAIDSVGRR